MLQPCQTYQTAPIPPAFALKPVNKAKLQKLLARFKGGKALAGDTLDGHLLKVSSKVTLSALVQIVNLSIRSQASVNDGNTILWFLTIKRVTGSYQRTIDLCAT